jgi:hypothetical protein
MLEHIWNAGGLGFGVATISVAKIECNVPTISSSISNHIIQCMWGNGVVHANVGQKRLNCFPLRVFSGDR